MPLITAFPVSQSNDGDTFGVSFISKKFAHSLLTVLSNSGSFSKDMLKRQVEDGFICVWFYVSSLLLFVCEVWLLVS